MYGPHRGPIHTSRIVECVCVWKRIRCEPHSCVSVCMYSFNSNRIWTGRYIHLYRKYSTRRKYKNATEKRPNEQRTKEKKREQHTRIHMCGETNYEANWTQSSSNERYGVRETECSCGVHVLEGDCKSEWVEESVRARGMVMCALQETTLYDWIKQQSNMVSISEKWV